MRREKIKVVIIKTLLNFRNYGIILQVTSYVIGHICEQSAVWAGRQNAMLDKYMKLQMTVKTITDKDSKLNI